MLGYQKRSRYELSESTMIKTESLSKSFHGCKKMNIHTSIKLISSSIKDRGSKQGEKVFAAALEQLPELDSTEERASF